MVKMLFLLVTSTMRRPVEFHPPLKPEQQKAISRPAYDAAGDGDAAESDAVLDG